LIGVFRAHRIAKANHPLLVIEMTIEHFVLTAEVQTFLLGLLAILCLIKYRSRSSAVRLLGFIFFAGFLANISSWLFTRIGTLRQFSNLPGIIYFVVSVGLISYLYLVALFKKRRLWAFVVTGASIVIAVVNFYLIQKTSVNSNLFVIHAGMLISFTLWYFYVLMRDLPSLHVHQMPMFWFNSAFLVLGAGTFVLYAFTSYLIHVLRDDMITYWSIHNILSIFAHLIVLIGLYFDFNQLKSNRMRQDTGQI
jgi:hypothetical protein